MRKKLPKLLVTGGAGFIGSEFVRQAVGCGYKVTVVDALSYAGDRERLAFAQKTIKFYKADICDYKAMYALFGKEKPDAVVHFAAETHVDRSILEARAFLETNISGTHALMDAARAFKTAKFIHISTDEVYGDIEKGRFTENTGLSPNSPYSASKAAADLLIKSYMRTYGFPAIIVRPSNNYGPWQYPEKLMPVIIYKATHNLPIPVYARGQNVREWLYVSDCAAGILTVLRKGGLGEVYNIGSGYEKKNIDVVKAVLKFLGKPFSLITYVKDRPGHDIRYALDTQKIRALGWSPRVNFETGVVKTALWYQQHCVWLEGKASFLAGYWKKVYKKC